MRNDNPYEISNKTEESSSKLFEALEKIEEEFKFHVTPDTIAKKYFHSGDQEMLNQLKSILIIYFLYEQTLDLEIYNNDEIIKERIDKRYDAFIASILKPIYWNQFYFPNEWSKPTRGHGMDIHTYKR